MITTCFNYDTKHAILLQQLVKRTNGRFVYNLAVDKPFPVQAEVFFNEDGNYRLFATLWEIVEQPFF